jgi:hypothetical protein
VRQAIFDDLKSRLTKKHYITCKEKLCYSSTKSCLEIYTELENISFKISEEIYDIQPLEYLISNYSPEIKCLVPISVIENEAFHAVTLGTVFLRTIFTLLDFETKQVSLAYSNGDPEIPSPKNQQDLTLSILASLGGVLLMIVLFGIAYKVCGNKKT